MKQEETNRKAEVRGEGREGSSLTHPRQQLIGGVKRRKKKKAEGRKKVKEEEKKG